MRFRAFIACVALVLSLSGSNAAEPVHYRFSFPEPEHHWVQVEATFAELGDQPLELRMSRSSPGRYSLHDFAKNVYDVQAVGKDGRSIALTRPDPYGWTAAGHGGAVTVKYKVFGDRVDGTYLAIDTTHAHINMPAAVMWARGLDDRPATVSFAPPPASVAADGQPAWRVATQLYPGATSTDFSAPNLQYLMDSPAEFGPIAMREFSIDDRKFRFALHHTGTDVELDGFVSDVQKIVRAEGAVFGEYPAYEPGSYTFLADYLPYASGDGMEHRNSTVITSQGAIATGRRGLLSTVAHEFFHNWNMERIRARSLEPFDFERANISSELWLGEGFTQYYGPLALSRAGLSDLRETSRTMLGLIASISDNPARLVRSAEEMSQMAAFTDGGRTNDRTNWSNTYISYYPFGGAIALALDLSLRERSSGRVSLDDYMRAMWQIHGKPGGARPGYVDRPYTMADAEARLAEVSGDRVFAREFFARYIDGHEAADYSRLLLQAGLVLRNSAAGRASIGDVRLEPRGAAMVLNAPPPIGSPAYEAGLDVGDELKSVDGSPVTSAASLTGILQRHAPGDSVAVVYVDRGGVERRQTVKLTEAVQLTLDPIEATGSTLSAAQQTFRSRWLGSR
jgi:predicted metalloprotease with PDZ domain